MPLYRRTLPFVVAALLPLSVPASAAAQDPLPGRKSETKALLWSLLGTVVPAGAAILLAPAESDGSNQSIAPGLVFFGSALIGPSLGHFYSGRSGRAFIGIGVRTAAFVGLAGGFAAAWNGNSGGDALMLASLALGGGVLAYDIIRAPHSARVHNQRMQSARISIGLTGSTRAPGVRIGAKVSF